MIFIVHFIVIVFLFVFSKVFLKNEKFFIGATFLYSIFVFGQRWMVGTDYGNYLMYYIYDFQGTELGYRTLQNLFSNYELSFSLLTFLLYFLTQVNFYKFICKFGKNATWILFIYCLSEIYFAETSQIRQWIAISFFINAYYYFFYKKYFKSIGLIIIGALFHKSIMFVVPLLFIRLDKLIKNKYGSLLFVLILVILPFINLNILLPYFSFIGIVNDYLGTPYIVGLSFLHILKYYFLIICTFFFLYNLDKIKNNLYYLIINGQLIFLTLYGLSMQLGAFIRFSAFFKIFEIIFFVCLVSQVKKFNKTQLSFVFVIYFIAMYISIAVLDTVEISHYQIRFVTIFEQYTDIELIDEFYNFLEKVGRLPITE
ncbi:EpsG family protein [Solibacillus silvestris]|uniref:EpsG family protein n=1 Tax=Solibacillus silvestris TaxID=76853 RepID=UPI003F7DAFA9